MGSGYLPMEKYDFPDEIKKLKEALKLIEEVYNECHQAVYGESDQFDNATSDGYYLGYMSLAQELLKRCIKNG